MTRLLALALAGCAALRGAAADAGDELEPLCSLADATCGKVFLCTGERDGEWCWRDDSATELEDALASLGYGDSCSPTPRGGSLGLPCLYSCPSPAHGCNARGGCLCP